MQVDIERFLIDLILDLQLELTEKHWGFALMVLVLWSNLLSRMSLSSRLRLRLGGVDEFFDMLRYVSGVLSQQY